jgi:hypothetical protein
MNDVITTLQKDPTSFTYQDILDRHAMETYNMCSEQDLIEL